MSDLKIKLEEQLRIYQDSPATTVTYIDLARMVEDLIAILEEKKVTGFEK